MNDGGQCHRSGESVRRLRMRLGMTQSEIAEAAGLSQSFISRLERGRVERARPGAIDRLAGVLGVPAIELLPTGRGPEPRPSGLRVGVWKSVANAPALLLRERFPGPFSIAVRSLELSPDLPDGTEGNGRGLTPRELIRGLEAGRFDCVLVPWEVLVSHPGQVVECAEVARVHDGLRIALHAGGEAVPGLEDALPTSCVARLRSLTARGSVPVFFPFDVGASEIAHQIREAYGAEIELHAVSLDRWSDAVREEGARVAREGMPLLLVAPEPYLEACRRELEGCTAPGSIVDVPRGAVLPGSHAAVLTVGLAFHPRRVDAWTRRDEVYRLVEHLEHEALEVERRTPRAMKSLSEELDLDETVLARELDACDFSPRFVPAWVERLRRTAPEPAPRRRVLAP